MRILDSNNGRSCNCCGLRKGPADSELLQQAHRALQRLDDRISDVEKWRDERSRMRILMSQLQEEVARLGDDATQAAKLNLKREIDDLKNCNRSLEERVSEMMDALSVVEENVPCRRMKKLYGTLRRLVKRCVEQQNKIVVLGRRVKELEDVQELAGNVRCSDSNRQRMVDVGIDRQASIHEAEVTSIGRTDAVSSELCDCRTELSGLRELFERMQLQLIGKDESVGRLVDRNAFLDEQLTKMIAKSARREVEAKELRELLNEKDALLNELRTKLRVAPESTEALIRTVETSEETIRLRCLLKEKEKLTEELKAKLKSLKEELVDGRHQAARSMAAATEKMVALQINRSRLSDEVDVLRAENRRYKARIDECEGTICARSVGVSEDEPRNKIGVSVSDRVDRIEEFFRDGREVSDEVVSKNRKEVRFRDKQEDPMPGVICRDQVQTKDEGISVGIHEDKCDSQTITEMKLTDLDKIQTELSDRMKVILDVKKKLKDAEATLDTCQTDREESQNTVTKLTARLTDAESRAESLLARLRVASDREEENNSVAACLREKARNLQTELDAERLRLREAHENIKEFERKASTLERLMKELNALRDEVAKRIVELEAKARTAESNCNTYKEKLSMRELDSKRKLCAAIDKAKKCDSKFAILYKKLFDFEKLVADLEGKLRDERSDAASVISRLKGNLEESEDNLRTERAKSSLLENRLHDFSNEARDADNRLKNIAEVNASLRANVKLMEEKLKTDRASIVDLRNELKKAEDSIKMERARSVALEKELRDQIGTLLTKEKDRESKFIKMQKRLLDTEARVVALGESLAEAEKRVSDLNNTLRTEQEKFAVEAERMRSEINEAKNNLEAERANCSAFEEKVKNQLRKVLDKAKDCEAKFAVLQGKVVDAERRAFDVERKLAAKEAESAERIRELEFALKEAKDELNCRRARIDELENAVERLSSSMDNLREELKEMAKHKVALEEKLNSAEENLKNEKKESMSLRGKLDRLENSFESAKREAQLANASLKQLVAKGAGDGIKLVELENKLRQADEAVRKLKSLLRNNAVDTAFKATQASVVITDSGQAPEEVYKVSKITQVKKDHGTDFGQTTVQNEKVTRSTVTVTPIVTASSQTFEPLKKESRSVEVRTVGQSIFSQTPDQVRGTSKGTETEAVEVTERGQETERIERASKKVEAKTVDTVESGQTPRDVEKTSKGIDIDKPRSMAVGQVTEAAEKSTMGTGMKKVHVRDFNQDTKSNEKRSRAVETKETEKRDFGETTESIDRVFKGIQVERTRTVESGQVPSEVEKVSRGTDGKRVKVAPGSVITEDIDKSSKAVEVERTLLKDAAEGTEEATKNCRTIETEIDGTTDEIDKSAANVRAKKRSLTDFSQTRYDLTKEAVRKSVVEVIEDKIMKEISGEIQRKETRTKGLDRTPSEIRKDSKPAESGQTKALRFDKLSDKVNARDVSKPRKSFEEASKREKPMERISRGEETTESTDSAKDEVYFGSRVIEMRNLKNVMKCLKDENELLKRQVVSRKNEPFDVEGWLQSLTLTELAELHDRLCNITGRLIQQDIMTDDKELLYESSFEYLEPYCYCPGLAFETKCYSCVSPSASQRENTKIAALQKEIQWREYEAEIKMNGLERAIRQGQLRLSNLKDEINTHGRYNNFDFKARR